MLPNDPHADSITDDDIALGRLVRVHKSASFDERMAAFKILFDFRNSHDRETFALWSKRFARLAPQTAQNHALQYEGYIATKSICNKTNASTEGLDLISVSAYRDIAKCKDIDLVQSVLAMTLLAPGVERTPEVLAAKSKQIRRVIREKLSGARDEERKAALEEFSAAIKAQPELLDQLLRISYEYGGVSLRVTGASVSMIKKEKP